MSSQTELGGFLRTRRARLRPVDAGLPDYGDRRRVPGLRREEVAQAAGVSLGYYTRLEQGQSGSASDAVLDAVAEVLLLNEEERSHLHLLAAQPRTLPKARPERLRQAVVRLVGCFDQTPALVTGRRTDVLHWNPIAHALFAGHLPLDAPVHPHQRPNMARMVFLDPPTRELYVDWDRKAHDVVAYLRGAAAQWPHDGKLTSLIGELCIRSPEFSELWASHPVRTCAYNTRDYRHPLVGSLTLHDEILDLPDDEGQRVVTLYPEPGTSAALLDRLGRITSAR